MRVSDYIANVLSSEGICTLFSITGGFAMHLNDSFGTHPGLQVYYNHHEQSCGYAAVGYTKTNGIPSAVCATAGAATTNCVTPCLIAYQDSVPVLFLTGQVKTMDSIRFIHARSNPALRNYAFADCDIISIVNPITKYSHELTSVAEVKSVMQTAIIALKTGRPGPVWISIPLDIQGAQIDELPLVRAPSANHADPLDPRVLSLIQSASRPIVLAGNGIKLANCREKFLRFLERYDIPAVTTLLGLDLLETDSPYFAGRVGSYGDRAGNFSIQNSDLVIVLGSSLSSGIVGYKPEWFAREAARIHVDIDSTEFLKPAFRCDVTVAMDLNQFFDSISLPNQTHSKWRETCLRWKAQWMFEMPPSTSSLLNPYPVLYDLFNRLPANKTVVSMTGSIATLVWHMFRVKAGDTFVFSGQGDMGPDLPASIGAYLASPDRPVFTIVGEGAFQFNIQELQTIVHHKMPIKMFVFNNASYGAIEITQRANFKTLHGLNSDSGVSFPDTGKIATAYGIPYIPVWKHDEIAGAFEAMMAESGPVLVEIFCCVQGRYPKLSARKLPDGSFTSLPFEDMEPFLPRDVFHQEMIVKPLSETPK